MKAFKCLAIAITASAITIFLGCGDDNESESHTQLINGFGTELRESLPEVTPTTKKGSPADVEYENYADTQTYGGLFQRVLGDDPLSIFFTVDMTDQLISELLYEENPYMIFGGSRELTLPFFGDSITFNESFIYDVPYTFSFTLTYEDQSATMTATIDDFRGGYTDDSIAISYNLNIPDFVEGTTIYFAERNSEGKLYIRYASFGTEIHEGASPFTTYNSRNVYFLRDIENDPYTYKSAGITTRIDNNDEGVFSIIMGGVTEEFLIRRRAYCDETEIDDRFIDQLIAATYDESTHHVGDSPLEEQYEDDSFDTDGEGFTDTNGGLGDTITLTDPDATYLQIYADRIKASNMFDFSEPTHLPQSEDDVTPVGWDF